MAVVPYLYLADIGDNDRKYEYKYIYRFAEPKSVAGSILQFERMKFKLSDESRDSGAIIIDPLSTSICYK